MDKRQKFNILHIDSFKDFGGAQTDISVLLENINKYYGDECNVFVIHNDNKRFKEELERKGIKNASVKMRNFLDFIAIFKIRKLIKKWKIDLINMHSPRDHYLGGIASILIPGKKIVRVLTRHVAYKTSFVKGFLIYKFLTDYFIAISDFIKGRLIKDLMVNPDKIRTIYSPRINRIAGSGNDCEPEKKKPVEIVENMVRQLRDSMGIKPGDKMVSLIGRLSKEKGHSLFILAAKEIVKERNDVKFVIIGEGELYEKISSAISKNGLEKYFIMLGFQNNISEFITASDIIAVPSGLEGMGSIIIESCALRKAVIASDVGGIPEVVRDGETGLLFENGRHEELAFKINKLLNDEELAARLADNCHKDIIAKFDARKIASETVALYARLLKKA